MHLQKIMNQLSLTVFNNVQAALIHAMKMLWDQDHEAPKRVVQAWQPLITAIQGYKCEQMMTGRSTIPSRDSAEMKVQRNLNWILFILQFTSCQYYKQNSTDETKTVTVFIIDDHHSWTGIWLHDNGCQSELLRLEIRWCWTHVGLN